MDSNKATPPQRIYDQGYLKDLQYRTSANLEARINLHRLFGTNSYPWARWVFEHLQLEPGLHVLEVGCGPGRLWSENVERIPENVSLYLGDLSTGMAQTAHRNIQQADPDRTDKLFHLHGLCLDVQSIPFPQASFDGVIANHMLYHVPDIHLAVCELKRATKPGGWVMTATNGEGHMRQLGEILATHWPDYRDSHRTQVKRYSLENAAQYLRKSFQQVETHIYTDHLHITEVQPLMDYIASMWDAFEPINPEAKDRLVEQIQNEIDREGYFLIHKSQGILLARA